MVVLFLNDMQGDESTDSEEMTNPDSEDEPDEV